MLLDALASCKALQLFCIALISLCIAIVALLAALTRFNATTHQPSASPIAPSLPLFHPLFGHHTYPTYDPAFNLRLSYLYGPAIHLQNGLSHPLSFILSILRFVPLTPSAVTSRTWREHDTTLLLNSEPHAKHILDRLGAHYSSRAPSIAAAKYLSDGKRLVLQPYGGVWRTHHRALMSVLSRDKLHRMWDPVMRYEAGEMVLRIMHLLDECNNQSSSLSSLLKEPSRFTASSVLQIAYARRAATPQDSILADLDGVSQGIAKAFEPGRFLVDRFPLLDLLPPLLAPWKRTLLAWHQAEHRVYEGLIEDVQDRLGGLGSAEAKGKMNLAGGSILDVSDCATAMLLSDQVKLGLDKKDIAYIAATIFEAGTETTAMTIQTFLLAMACHPSVATRVQEELDSLFPSPLSPASVEEAERGIPDFDTLRSAPYLTTVLKETLRFTPTGSSGVAHTSSRRQADDISPTLPFTIPAGVTILPNIYGIHRTPLPRDTTTSLWTFDPTRHLDPDKANEGTTSLDLTPSTHAFGFGRRKCPGSVLASHSLFISCAFLLHSFSISLHPCSFDIIERVVRQEEMDARVFQRRFPDVLETKGWKEERRSKINKDDRLAVLLDGFTRGKVTSDEVERCLVWQVRDNERVQRTARWVEMVRGCERAMNTLRHLLQV